MSYERKVFGDPACRRFAVDVFDAALDTEFRCPKIRSSFLGDLHALWPDAYQSPFFIPSTESCPSEIERSVFEVVLALGFSVGCLDSYVDAECSVSTNSPEMFDTPAPVSYRSGLWINEGPIRLNNVLSALSPVDPEFMATRTFYLGYAGGVGYLERFLGEDTQKA